MRIYNCNIRFKMRRAVTLLEVMFAMFVILFGLIGIVVLIPTAARQAADSYSLTHGAATAKNAKAEVSAIGSFQPSPDKPWWFANDEAATMTGPFQVMATNPSYISATTLANVLQFVQQRAFENFVVPNPPGDATEALRLRTDLARREGLAQGFCIDPQFCADQFITDYSATGWRYPYAYSHLRGSATQLLFRRTRMPCFDERTILAGNSFAANAGANFPKLMRVSIAAGAIQRTIADFNVGNLVLPAPMKGQAARLMASSVGDLIQAEPTEDKSFGALRGYAAFQNVGTNQVEVLKAIDDAKVTWLASLTPNESTAPGTVPSEYDLNLVLFANRDTSFDAVPLGISGAETFPTGEKFCFATAATGASASPAPLIAANSPVGDLPFSDGASSLQVALYSDALTNPDIRTGQWVLLSRRMVTGNRFNAIDSGVTWPVGASPRGDDYKVVHRHRWYRIIGIDPGETWPRVVRLEGPAWDYPEIAMTGAGGPVLPLSVAPLLGPSTPTFTVNNSLTFVNDLRSVATTATVFSNVIMVYNRTVSVEQ